MKSDLSSIIGGIVIFISFLISLAILQYFINLNTERTLEVFDKKAKFYYEKSLELVDILNNETNSTNPYIIIKNIGKISFDLSCFKIYVNSYPVNFSYTIYDVNNDGLLNPGEIANITLPTDIQGWKKIEIISCKGNRFETLLYYK